MILYLSVVFIRDDVYNTDMSLLLRLLFNALGLILIAKYVPGISVEGLYPAIISAFTLGVLNVFIRPILLILTFPITVITIGLFAFVVNALLFYFAASFIDGFAVDGFVYALIGSLFMSIVSTIGNRWINSKSAPAQPRVEYREVRD